MFCNFGRNNCHKKERRLYFQAREEGGMVVLAGSSSIGRNNVAFPQHVGSIDRESVHWKECHCNNAGNGREHREYVRSPCVQGVFTRCLAYISSYPAVSSFFSLFHFFNHFMVVEMKSRIFFKSYVQWSSFVTLRSTHLGQHTAPLFLERGRAGRLQIFLSLLPPQ